jgi:DNA-directed RNA polymerase sigma subunit (sigma70/sigma32)
MIYKFKSKAAGDLVMTQPVGDELLRLMGKEPAAKGIIEVAQMAANMAALEQAVRADDVARAQDAENDAETAVKDKLDRVSLRQRAWPLIDMMKRCADENAPIVWGV